MADLTWAPEVVAICARLDGGRDRPAANPGGMECERCGCIFIGAEWHRLCRVCEADAAAFLARVRG